MADHDRPLPPMTDAPLPAWAKDVLDLWFDHVGPSRWFGGPPELDEEIRERFEPLWHAMKGEPASAFSGSARLALAGVILFDQLPRNMFRHDAARFDSDDLARDIADAALAHGLDRELSGRERQFLYTPFMHSEALGDQERSVMLFEALAEATGDHEPARFAILHRDIVARWGRFPHRNALLGREMRPGEADAAAEGANW